MSCFARSMPKVMICIFCLHVIMIFLLMSKIFTKNLDFRAELGHFTVSKIQEIKVFKNQTIYICLTLLESGEM